MILKRCNGAAKLDCSKGGTGRGAKVGITSKTNRTECFVPTLDSPTQIPREATTNFVFHEVVTSHLLYPRQTENHAAFARQVIGSFFRRQKIRSLFGRMINRVISVDLLYLSHTTGLICLNCHFSVKILVTICAPALLIKLF